VDMHATGLVRINGITRVLLVYTCQQGVCPRGYVLPLRLPHFETGLCNLTVNFLLVVDLALREEAQLSLYVQYNFKCLQHQYSHWQTCNIPAVKRSPK
jgi:hypothetical protein